MPGTENRFPGMNSIKTRARDRSRSAQPPAVSLNAQRSGSGRAGRAPAWVPPGHHSATRPTTSPSGATWLSQITAVLSSEAHPQRFRPSAAIAVVCILILGSVLGVAAVSFANSQVSTVDLPFLPAVQLPAIGVPQPSPPPAAAPAPTAPPAPAQPPTVNGVPVSSLVADAAVSSVSIFSGPGGAVVSQVPGYNIIGQREAFLVTDQSTPGWYQVELPTKPVNSQGWVRASDVTTRTDPYFIQVNQSAFTLQLFDAGQLQHSFTVAVGAPSTPTPNGNFFVWASQSWNQAPYATGIFALSTFSAVLGYWVGGGRIGIHGWQDTSILGTRASHGCVRMSGADFAQLLNTVPLGTPVQINE
jgi:lipoprotein-anchoring transpeptidase ErfK/SrfK